MAKTQFMQIRIEPELKQKVEAMFSEMGLSVSEAVTLFFAQVAIRGEIPFTIRATPLSTTTFDDRSPAKKLLKSKQTPFNIDKRIGYTARLVSPVTAHTLGTIKINDVLWQVAAKTPIESGKSVKITEIEGSKFWVEAVDGDGEIFPDKQ